MISGHAKSVRNLLDGDVEVTVEHVTDSLVSGLLIRRPSQSGCEVYNHGLGHAVCHFSTMDALEVFPFQRCKITIIASGNLARLALLNVALEHLHSHRRYV